MASERIVATRIGYVRLVPPYVRFYDMTWPSLQGARDLSRLLRYGKPTRGKLLLAASIADAYVALVEKTTQHRADLVMALRKADRMDDRDGG